MCYIIYLIMLLSIKCEYKKTTCCIKARQTSLDSIVREGFVTET